MSSTPETTPAPIAAPASVIGRYRWVICGLLFFATTILYIDRQILALLKDRLDQQFHWSNEEFGIVAACFQAAYAGGFIFFGWFVDRFGTKLGYAITIAGWSLAACGHWFVSSILQLKLARAFLGLSESGNFPSAIKATALWFPGKERALATALFNSGANVGPILAPAIIPVIADAWGWRAAFVCIGSLGFIWLAAWQYFYETPEKHRHVSPAELAYIRSYRVEPAKQAKIPWVRLLRYPQTWSFIVGKALTDPVWWFFLTWLPDYFKKTRGMEIKKSWGHLATIYVICTILSIFGGWLPGWFLRRGWTVTRARKTSMIIFALCVLSILLVQGVSAWTAVLLIGLAAAAHQAWSANLFTTVSDMFPQRAVASVIGLGGMAGSLSGLLFPVLTGRLLDKFAANPAAGYSVLFGICGCAYLIAFFFNNLLAPRFEQITLDLPEAGHPA